MKDRNLRGTKEKKEIVIKDDDQSYNCLLADMSASGISVITEHFIPTYKVIEVFMEIGAKKLAMKGSVRWSIDAGTSRDKMGKLGIFIMDPPPEFLEYVKTREK